MLIDSHCHLNHDKNDDTPAEIIARAKRAGVAGMLTINTHITNEFDDILTIATAHDTVWCTVGTHPHEASDESIPVHEILAKAQSHNKVIGIGESGLDYFYDFADRDDQKSVFRTHIRACLETDLPLIIHARDACDDIIQIMSDEDPHQKLRGVFHCFSSTQKLADFAMDIGFYIGVSGIVTFKKSDELRDIIKNLPLDRLLIETDAPYLAPAPHRGKTNEPAYAVHTAQFLADMSGVDHETVCAQTTENFKTLFSVDLV